MKSLALALLALAACNPTLIAQTTPPPGRAARLDPIDGFWGTKAYRLELSQGVAIAVTCTKGRPCEKVTARAADPALVEVRDASLARLEPNNAGVYAGHQATATALVIVGKAPGTTKIHLTSEQGSRDIYVTIVPPPRS
jgi:hypothetical protein